MTQTKIISATTPDWSRETPTQFWDPGRKLLKSIRDYDRYNKDSSFLSVIGRKIAILRHRFWSIVTGCEIHLGTDIGGGLLMPHPLGIVIHPRARIGPNCMIMHQVTIGVVEIDNVDPQNPSIAATIGGHVDVGAGAKILGSIEIGEHALIGANAVVTHDVPARKTAVGIPATLRDQKPRMSVPPTD